MATQRAAPPTGTAKREISKTASEGHFLSAASFVDTLQSTCATKAERGRKSRFEHRQAIAINTLTCGKRDLTGRRPRASVHHELQNPAYSLQTRRQTPQPRGRGFGDGSSKQRTAGSKANDFQQLGGTTEVVPFPHMQNPNSFSGRNPRRSGSGLEIRESM